MTITRRAFLTAELRAQGDADKRTLSGMAAVYDQPSEPIAGWFVEYVRPGAFANTIKTADVRALWNHDPNHVLGRNKAGTLRLYDDPRGLRVEIDLPSTPMADAVYEGIKRGDISQMSFGFRTIKDRWTYSKSDKEMSTRELLEVELFDVSPVAYPAYPQTSINARSDEELAELRARRDQFLRAERTLSDDDLRRMIALAEAEATLA